MVVFGTSLEASEAGRVAARLAVGLGVPLRLVHVAQEPRTALVLDTEEVRARLEAEACALAAATGADVRPQLAAGSAPDALAEIARYELADLLVVGVDADADTADRVARQSPVPVLALREVAPVLAWLEGQRPLRVLVGADEGQAAQAARALAVRLAQVGPCEVEVAQVAAPVDVHARLGLPQPVDPHHLSPEAAEVLRRALARTAPPGEVATLRVIEGRGGADAHLVARVDQGDFDLVLVGQRRRSLVEQLWYGSVARGVLRSAPVSVVCVPPPLGASPPAVRPAEVVLVGVDFSEVSDRAVAQALALVAPGGQVHLAHVMAGEAPADSLWRELARRGQAADDRSQTTERHLVAGQPEEQLLALAERIGADLIVLGTRSRPRLARMLLGSVARAVSERSRVPVVLVPPVPH